MSERRSARSIHRRRALTIAGSDAHGYRLYLEGFPLPRSPVYPTFEAACTAVKKACAYDGDLREGVHLLTL